jgi:hypothetical protein
MVGWISDSRYSVDQVKALLRKGPPLPSGVMIRICDGGQQCRSVKEFKAENPFFRGLMEQPANYPDLLIYSSKGLSNEEKTFVSTFNFHVIMLL